MTDIPPRPAAALVLRLARAGDGALVRRLSAEAYIPAYEAVIGTAPKPATEDYAPRIARGEVHVLELAGEPAGVLVLEPAPDHAVIYSIAVAPPAQGCGLGKALLEFAAQLARAAGAPELRLYTNTRMARNVALYRGAGFAETGTRPHPSRPGEFLVDMARRL